MAFTYTDNPVDNPQDAVRLMVNDRDSTRAIFADDEIAWFLAQEENIYMAAAFALETFAGNDHGIKRKKVGSLEIEYDADQIRASAKQFRVRGSGHQVLTAGGVSLDDRKALDEDTDLIQPYFEVGQHDFKTRSTSESDRELP